MLRGRGMPVLQRLRPRRPARARQRRRAAAGSTTSSGGCSSSSSGARRRRVPDDGDDGLLRPAQERVPLSVLRRVSVTVPAERAEQARARMIELVPRGLRGARARRRGRARRVHDAATARSGSGAAFGGASAADVEPGWEDRWRDFHRPVVVGRALDRAAVGDAARRRAAVVIDPGRAFGTGAHPTTRLCLELLAGAARAAACSTSAAAPACSRSPRRGSATGRCTARRRRPVAVEATRANARRERRRASTPASLDALAGELPAADVVVANIAPGAVARSLPRVRCAAASPPATSSRTRRRLAGFATSRGAERRRLGGRSAPPRVRSSVRRVATVLRRASSAARSRTRTPRRSASACSPTATTRRAGGADVAVVNTCCVTHEAVAKSRQAAARAARTHGRVYVTGCGANLARTRSRACPRTSSSSRSRARRRPPPSRATSARSAASRPTRGSTACARS